MDIRISPYTWLLLAGVVISFLFWKRRARQDKRLVFIYGAALIGAFFGAKIVYLLAEGWLHFGAPDMWPQLAAGKSILGALLGGYVFVELAKRTSDTSAPPVTTSRSSRRSVSGLAASDACSTAAVSVSFAGRIGMRCGTSMARRAGPQFPLSSPSISSRSLSSFFFAAESFCPASIFIFF
jgi:prolipoprotein diacylglyceryltransferase